MTPDHILLEHAALCLPVSIVMVPGATQAHLINELVCARAVVRAAQSTINGPGCDAAVAAKLAALSAALADYYQIRPSSQKQHKIQSCP
jgi:hypothetical protein